MEILEKLPISYVLGAAIGLILWSIRLEAVAKSNAQSVATHNKRIVTIFERLDEMRIKLQITEDMAERHEKLWSPDELKKFWMEWAAMKSDINHLKDK